MGMLQGLQDPTFLERKQVEEERLIAVVQSDPQLTPYAGAWRTIEEVQTRKAELLRKGVSLDLDLFRIAQTLVRIAAEDQKPSPERLREYRDSARESLLQELLSPAPIYKDLEQIKLADLLGFLVEERGGDDPLVQRVLDGKSPRDLAAELVQGTALDGVAARRSLLDGGAAAIEASQDAMIRFACLIDPESRSVRDSPRSARRAAAAGVCRCRGSRLRHAGYLRQSGRDLHVAARVRRCQRLSPGRRNRPVLDHLRRRFEHERLHGAREPWQIPARWQERKEQLDPQAQFNFVCTADIIGGNSGSPVVNRDLELVGLIFDGNIQSLSGDFRYDEELDRAVSVSSVAIRQALRHVYGASELADELGQ